MALVPHSGAGPLCPTRVPLRPVPQAPGLRCLFPGRCFFSDRPRRGLACRPSLRVPVGPRAVPAAGAGRRLTWAGAKEGGAGQAAQGPVAAAQSEEQQQQQQRVEFSYDPKGTMERYAQATDPDRTHRGPASLTLFSPSKVNVFLRITRKRPDNYHDLASLFHTISLGDVLKFSLSPSQQKDSLTTTASGVPLDESNLVIKALNLFRNKTGINKFFWIHLEKNVPTGAGLGGGSGNAATALWAANQMSGCPVEEEQLQLWSAEIGSDIPFFFSHGAAYCTGRGEIVQDLSPSELTLTDPLVLMKPQAACSTAEVYKRFSLSNASQEDPVGLLRQIMERGISQATCINDLEPPAFEVLPSLQALKKRIQAASRNRFSAVFMSGSGSTIVGVGDPEAPPFLYEEDAYKDVFISEASFIRRSPKQWYQASGSGSGIDSAMELSSQRV